MRATFLAAASLLAGLGSGCGLVQEVLFEERLSIEVVAATDGGPNAITHGKFTFTDANQMDIINVGDMDLGSGFAWRAAEIQFDFVLDVPPTNTRLRLEQAPLEPDGLPTTVTEVRINDKLVATMQQGDGYEPGKLSTHEIDVTDAVNGGGGLSGTKNHLDLKVTGPSKLLLQRVEVISSFR